MGVKFAYVLNYFEAKNYILLIFVCGKSLLMRFSSRNDMIWLYMGTFVEEKVWMNTKLMKIGC